MAGKLPSAIKSSFTSLLSDKERIGIIVSDWNQEITTSLLSAARKVFNNCKLEKHQIIVHVPGAFEIPLAASLLLKKKNIKGVICLGCVIKGDTKHDDYINQSIAQSFSNLSIQYSKPVIFGVLTTNHIKQAKERAGGKLGNKGEEAAIALLKMIQIKELIKTL